MRLTLRSLITVLVLVSALAIFAAAAEVKDLVKEVFPIPSVTGNENGLAAKIASLLPKSVTSQTDNLGSLYARVGIGGPAILAGLDEFGYLVSVITADGFLRLDRATPLPIAIYDSFLVGHPVAISARKGSINGIVAQPAMHLMSRERREEWAKNLTLDMIFVDIGVRAESEARAKGIEILDPVTFRPELSVLAGDRWAGPALGQKAVCAALAAAARALANDAQAGADLVWMAQTRLPARGVPGSVGSARARARLGARPALILDAVAADRGDNSPVMGKGLILIQAKEGPSKLREAVDAVAAEKNITLQYRTGGNSLLLASFLAEGGDALILALPARYAGTPSEIIDLKDVQAMADLVAGLGQIGRLR